LDEAFHIANHFRCPAVGIREVVDEHGLLGLEANARYPRLGIQILED
jgi:hypothetical protein